MFNSTITIIFMKYLFSLLLLVLLVHTQTPNCRLKQGRTSEDVWLSSNQSYSYSFKDFFAGFNLEYSATGEGSFFELIDPFTKVDSQIITNPPQDYSLLDFDIKTDEYQAWSDQAVSLGYSSNADTYYISYGTINQKMNVKNITTINFTADGTYQCFDIVAATSKAIVLDCQNKSSSSDFLVVYNYSDQKPSPKYYQDSSITKQRKTVVYRISGQRTYIISVWIGKGMEQRNKSFVKIYALDYNSVPQDDPFVVAAKDLNVADLDITDVTVDAFQNIYLADSRGTLFQFRYDGQKIYLGQKWNFGNSLSKVSVHTTHDLNTMIHVIGNQSIYQKDLGNPQRSLTYQLPSNVGTFEEIIDFQTSDDLLVVQTKQNYYIYQRYVPELNNMLDTFVTNESRFALSPRTPNMIIFGLNESSSYVISEGFIIAKNPSGQNKTIIVNATSYSIDRAKFENCSMGFYVSNVDNINKIYIKRQFQSQAKEAGQTINYYLDDYFLGSRLSYGVQGDGIDIKLKHNNLINILTDTSSYDVDWFATQSFDGVNYYKLSIQKQNLVTEYCSNDGSITCSVKKTSEFKQIINNYALFETILNQKQSAPVFAYTTLQNPKTIRFVQLNSDKTFTKQMPSGYNVTDIDANERYLFVTLTEGGLIYVLQNDFNNFQIVETINDQSLPFQHFDFKPQQCALSPTDINLLVIRNYQSIIIMRVTSFQVEFISQIKVDELVDGNLNSKIVIAGDSLLLFIDVDVGPDLMFEYSIFELYNPRHMRTLNSFGNLQILHPLEAYTIANGQFVALRTIDLNQTSIYLTIIKPGQPLAATVYQDWRVPKDYFYLSLVGLKNYAIIQFNTKSMKKQITSNSIPYSTNLKIFYYRPTMIVTSKTNQNSFKQTYTFLLNVSSPDDFKTNNKTLTFYNARTKIQPTSKTADKITLTSNSNSDETEVVIPADKQFDGPISKYNIECDYCGDKIKIKDHVTLLSFSQKISNVRAFYYFEDKNRLWSLTDGSIYISDNNLNVISQLKFDFNSSKLRAQNWVVDQNNSIKILFTSNSLVNSTFFVEITPSENRESGNFHPPTYITGKDQILIDNARVMKTMKNRIFVLDSSSNNEIGLINVFTWKKTEQETSAVYEGTLDGLQLYDFQLTDTVPDPQNEALLIVGTFKNQTLVFILCVCSDVFSPVAQGIYQLGGNPLISNFVADGKFLQLKVYSSYVDGQKIQLGLYMTVENGLHQQFVIVMKSNQPNLYEFQSLKHINSFAKYGNQTVLNWAQMLPNKDNVDNFLLIAHQGVGTSGNQISVGLYNRKIQNSQIIQQMTGAVEIPTQNSISNNFIGYMFRDGKNLKFVYSVSNDDKPAVKLYNLSETVSVVYKFQENGNFEEIKLVASNMYGSSSKMLPVQFTTLNPSGLAWYIILVIALGGLLVLGLVIFFVVKYRRSKASKDSLLSTSKTGSDEDI